MCTQTASLVIMLMVVSFFVNAQQLKLTNMETGYEVILKENTRVRVKTEEFKRAGRMKIMENDQLMIRNKVVNISDITKIKRQPLGMIIVVDGFFLLVGTVATGIALTGALIYGQGDLLLVLIPSGLFMGVSALTPNPLPAYRRTTWDYKIEY